MKKFLYMLGMIGLGAYPTHAQDLIQPGAQHFEQKEAAKWKGTSTDTVQEVSGGLLPVLGKRSLKKASKEPLETDKAHSPKLTNRSNVMESALNCAIENPASDPSFFVISPNDDASILVNLPFAFNYYGTNYTSLYVNNNGNITLDASLEQYTSEGFPNRFDMIAPFWADADTRHPLSGQVYYKPEATSLTVIWYEIGYYDEKVDKLNTFKVVLTDGTNPVIGAGNNIAFFYGDMQWTSGDASEGTNGLGGVPATVGVNNGSGGGSCFYYQIGRFGKSGTEFVDPFEVSGVDYLDNRCFFFDVSTREDLALDFTHQQYLCAVKFQPTITNPQNCKIDSYTWDLGDGNVSYEASPIHSYSAPGDYTVSLFLSYSCGDCQGNFLYQTRQVSVQESSNPLIDTLIHVVSEEKQEILSASIVTYSDAWALAHTERDLMAQHGYQNGSEGVWRPSNQYIYEVPRNQSNVLNMAQNGTFDMDLFNWEHEEIEAVPNWIRINSTTKYSPYSYEVENKNAIDVYNAALYDYGGHLPSANGYNMKKEEMAFTSFEYLVDGLHSGNWIFGKEPLLKYNEYATGVSFSHMVVVKANKEVFDLVDKVDVIAHSFFGFTSSTIRDNEILCIRQHPTIPDWSVLVLKRAPSTTIWVGYVRINNEVIPVETPDIDAQMAHSGIKSLKVTGQQSFEQPMFQLDSGKQYLVSAWVSVNNPHVLTPEVGSDLGIQVQLKNLNDQVLLTKTMAPSGVVIEGWQRLEGTFRCTSNDLTLTLTFKPGSGGVAWYDDLRLHPNTGNMTSYVYNLDDYRLQAILDAENFASFYYYDEEGNLFLTKKETIDGIKTLQENVSYQIER